MDVDRGIVAVIDAADDHIRLSRREFCQRHLHTVDGSAVARPYLDAFALGAQAQPQRFGGREGTGKAAAGLFGGTDEDVAHVGKHLHERVDALCLIAVIVGNKE